MELRKILPEKFWFDINTLLVTLGQNLCRPTKPKCELCPISGYCKTNLSKNYSSSSSPSVSNDGEY